LAQALRDIAADWQQSNECQVLVGITVVDTVLVVRALGEQSEAMLQLFAALWAHLRQQWLGKPACPPRIWAT